MKSRLLRAAVPLFCAASFLAVAGCGDDSSSSEPVAAAKAKAKDPAKLAAAKSKATATLKALAAKTSDPKLKKALEKAQTVLANAPTEEITTTFLRVYTLPKVTPAVVDTLNGVGSLFSLKPAPGATGLKVDFKAFEPRRGATASEMSLALADGGNQAATQADLTKMLADIRTIIVTALDSLDSETQDTAIDMGFAVGFLRPLLSAACVGLGPDGKVYAGPAGPFYCDEQLSVSPQKANLALSAGLIHGYAAGIKDLAETHRVNKSGFRNGMSSYDVEYLALAKDSVVGKTPNVIAGSV